MCLLDMIASPFGIPFVGPVIILIGAILLLLLCGTAAVIVNIIRSIRDKDKDEDE